VEEDGEEGGRRVEGDTATLKKGGQAPLVLASGVAENTTTRVGPKRGVAPQDQPIRNGWPTHAAAILSSAMRILKSTTTDWAS